MGDYKTEVSETAPTTLIEIVYRNICGYFALLGLNYSEI